MAYSIEQRDVAPIEQALAVARQAEYKKLLDEARKRVEKDDRPATRTLLATLQRLPDLTCTISETGGYTIKSRATAKGHAFTITRTPVGKFETTLSLQEYPLQQLAGQYLRPFLQIDE